MGQKNDIRDVGSNADFFDSSDFLFFFDASLKSLKSSKFLGSPWKPFKVLETPGKSFKVLGSS